MSSVSEAPHAAGVDANAQSPRGELALFQHFVTTKKPGIVARAYLESIRGELAERHFAGASGGDIVSGMTAAIDDLLRALYLYADADHGRRFSKLNQKISVVARGGYGRGEMNPQSDVDLLFIHDYKRGPYAENPKSIAGGPVKL